ncbi:MAG: 7-carboxy-7-deazaguanine synthase [Planctomycetota bacterium]|jgi:7-carboxy-7-deazaguanine synthase
MATSTTLAAAPVMEVFASIQGEGIWIGEPQVFLRLRGCPVRCRWCDTPGSLQVKANAEARIDALDGTRREAAWASAFQAACWVGEVEPREARTVSVTGGEPLLWPEFILALKPILGARRLHLETGGGHPGALAKVLDVCDHVSLDLKLPADLDQPVEVSAAEALESAPTNEEEWTLARRACLSLLADGRDACAKIVVADGHRALDYAPLLEDVARLAPSLPVILQPVTPIAGAIAPGPDFLTQLVEDARDLDLAVRVVPQVHRALGLK